jgi:hypothetical protein
MKSLIDKTDNLLIPDKIKISIDSHTERKMPLQSKKRIMKKNTLILRKIINKSINKYQNKLRKIKEISLKKDSNNF